MEKCPYCAEEIQDEAIKCRHCGEWLKKDVQAFPPQVDEAKKAEPSEAQHQLQAIPLDSDEKIQGKKEAGLKQCPTCGKWDVHRAYVEDGGMGDWCPHCNKSIPKVPSDIEKAKNNIKTAWITGVVIGCLNMLATITEMDITYTILTMAMFFGLSLGIYYKSIVCAVIMLAIWVVSFLVALFSAIYYGINFLYFIAFLSLLLCYPFFKGVKATFVYHELLKERNDAEKTIYLGSWGWGGAEVTI